MARLTNIPQRECEIGARLRLFRESKLISRTAFAISIGIGYQRLESYEAGRVPLPYGIFRVINSRYLLAAPWLVTGEGRMVASKALDEAELRAKPRDRELLSVAYDSVLQHVQESRVAAAIEYFFAPGGFVEVSEAILAALQDPEESKKIPRAAKLKLLAHYEELKAQLEASLALDINPPPQKTRCVAIKKRKP